MRWCALGCAALPAIILAVHAQRIAAHQPNAVSQPEKPYVVLVSLNGFRFDYPKKFGATHLLALAARGASAPDGMIPAYPSQTAPDLYTIVTGLYPGHHGIVAEDFYDPARRQLYRSRDPKTADDGSWYGGVPLWSLMRQQGVPSAALSWPGSQAKIAGERPSYSVPDGDGRVSDAQRIDRIITWLRLPASRRPHFIAVSLADVERAARSSGPDSRQAAAAARHLDLLLGTLERDLEAMHLPVDLVIVSDQGMASVGGDWIDLDSYAPLGGFITAGASLYAPSEAAANAAYQKLKAADARFMVYRRANVPAQLHFNGNPREGDPVIVARGPYAIRALSASAANSHPAKGESGFDPFLMPEMRGIFCAEGPDIRRGVTLQPFESVNIYPLIAEILGLKTPPSDGNVNILSGILNSSAAR